MTTLTHVEPVRRSFKVASRTRRTRRSPVRVHDVQTVRVTDDVLSLALLLADQDRKRIKFTRGPQGSVAALVVNRPRKA